jgi:hypothetical protein
MIAQKTRQRARVATPGKPLRRLVTRGAIAGKQLLRRFAGTVVRLSQGNAGQRNPAPSDSHRQDRIGKRPAKITSLSPAVRLNRRTGTETVSLTHF